MKKFYSLLTAVCILFMVSCSDSDDNENKINKSYSGEELAMKLNGFDAKGTVKLTSDDSQKGIVSFSNLIAGEKETLVDVDITTDASGAYSLTGTNANANREVKVEGTAGDKMNMTVTSKILSKAVGKWTPVTLAPNAIDIEVKAAEGATINMGGVYGKGVVSMSDFRTAIGSLGNLVFLMAIKFNLELKETGFLVADWKGGPMAKIDAGNSEDGVVKYNVIDDKIFVSIPLSVVMPQQRSTNPGSILDILTTGLPLNFSIAEDNKQISAWMTRDMILPYLSILKGVKPLLEGVEIPNVGGMITKEGVLTLFDEILRVIEESEEFTLKINLKATK